MTDPLKPLRPLIGTYTCTDGDTVVDGDFAAVQDFAHGDVIAVIVGRDPEDHEKIECRVIEIEGKQLTAPITIHVEEYQLRARHLPPPSGFQVWR